MSRKEQRGSTVESKPETSKAVAPSIRAEEASTVSPIVREWPETDLSLKQPFSRTNKLQRARNQTKPKQARKEACDETIRENAKWDPRLGNADMDIVEAEAHESLDEEC